MKISVDGVELFTLSDVQKKIISNDINRDILIQDLKRRLVYILESKYTKCLERLKEQWIPIIKSRYNNMPTNDGELAELIFSQPEYKDRKQRDEEEKEKLLSLL